MPLVVPGVTTSLTGNSTNDKTAEWQSKLLGKKIGEQSNEQMFAKKDLPSDHRVLEPGSMTTADHKPER